MSFESMPFTPRSGRSPSRTAAVHTLPAASRPGGRSTIIWHQLGMRTPARTYERTAASIVASRIVLGLSCATFCAVVVEAWVR